MKNKLKLLLILMISMLFFTSCEKEEFEISDQASPVQTTHQVRKISFRELKRNRKAYEKLKESRSKMNHSLLQRGVFNEDFGIFIDTTNILITEKDGKHSITFRIINEEELSKVENLVLNSKEDGSYKAFITEYLLSQEELTKLANNVEIGDKKPSAITDVSTYARFSITGDGADCISMLNYTVGYCLNANGQTIRDRGNNDGPAGTVCVSGWYEVEYQIMVIDAGCLSGGSGGGGSDSGGDNSGYNPGNGNWTGGGSPADGNPGNPNTGNPNTGNPNTGGNNNGNDPNPNPDFSDGSGNPIITTPILTIDKREVRLYNHLNTNQQTWWNNAPQETKDALLDYFNQNSPNNVVTDEAMMFILELIDKANQNPTFYTSEKIINWFFTANEGIDFEYDQEFWDNPNLTFSAQDLPTWADYSNGYPTETGADNVYGSVGGQVWQARINNPSRTTNTCALKVSIALNNCDVSIPNIPGKTLQGADGKFYFLNARALNSWMRKTFGVNPVNSNHHEFSSSEGGLNGINFPNLVSGLKGIYSMITPVNPGVSGHADILYEDGSCLAGCQFELPIERIDIWNLN